VADIGLMSALVARPDGTKGEAFLVHLGGGLGEGAAFGRKVRGIKVPAEHLADYVEGLVRRYRQRRDEGDTFGSIVARLDDEALARFAAPAAPARSHR
jgi:sulfite reductase (ferredoxin)